MVERLREAFALAEQRSEQEQEVLAAVLLDELFAEDRWDSLLADSRSVGLLERLAAEALADDVGGRTDVIAGDTFRS
jgi:hypothetical protein